MMHSILVKVGPKLARNLIISIFLDTHRQWFAQSSDTHNSITILLKDDSHPAKLHIRNSFFKFYFSQGLFEFLKI